LHALALVEILFISIPAVRCYGFSTRAVDNLLIAIGCTLIATVTASLIQQYMLAKVQAEERSRMIDKSLGRQLMNLSLFFKDGFPMQFPRRCPSPKSVF